MRKLFLSAFVVLLAGKLRAAPEFVIDQEYDGVTFNHWWNTQTGCPVRDDAARDKAIRNGSTSTLTITTADFITIYPSDDQLWMLESVLKAPLRTQGITVAQVQAVLYDRTYIKTQIAKTANETRKFTDAATSAQIDYDAEISSSTKLIQLLSQRYKRPIEKEVTSLEAIPINP